MQLLDISGSSYVLTSQKVLQDQYFKDFEIPFVLGRSNYACQKNKAMTCDLGACFREPKRRCKAVINGEMVLTCPYLVAKKNAFDSCHTNLNYSYFLAMSAIFTGSTDQLQTREIIICDECHSLESEMLKQCTVRLDEGFLKGIGCHDVKLPDIFLTDIQKINWLSNEFFERVRSDFLYLKTQLSSIKGMNVTKEYKKIAMRHVLLEKLLNSIIVIKKLIEKNEEIVVMHKDGVLEFKMLHCGMIFESLMQPHANRFLFMSASILDYKTFCEELKINLNDVEYIECDSIFPVENRMIHYMPVGSMSYKEKQKTLPKMIKKVEQILQENRNFKGIIHTVNYEIAEKIIDGLAFSKMSYRLLMPRGNDKQLILNSFYNSSKPLVLISPSLMEGIDLKDDLSRFCIICKMPYGNLGDKWIKTRMEESKKWYLSQACTNLIQMCGRSVRSEKDYAKTYILDSDFMNLAKNGIDIFPKWWKDAVVTY